MAAENPTWGAPPILKRGSGGATSFAITARYSPRWTSSPYPRRPSAPRHLIFDNDKTYGADVLAVIEHVGIQRKQITPYSPWQNGVAERWVETVRRDLVDHVIVLNERHLHRLLSEFVAY